MSSTRTSRRFHKAVKDEVFAIAYQIGVEEGKQMIVEQGKQIGIEEGERRSKLQIARTMIADGLCDEKIALYTGLSLSEIQKLRDGEPSEKE